MRKTYPITARTLWRLFAALVLFATPTIIIAKIITELRETTPIYRDTAFLQWFHQFSSPFLDWFAKIITNIGDIIIVVPVTVLLVAYLLYRRQRRAATFLLFGVGGAAVIGLTLKLLFQRARPELWTHLVTENGYSFPSGHAMMSSALALSIAALLWPTKYRWWAIGVGGFYVVIVGLSRLYLGVHFPTDVIGGWCLSFLWVLIIKMIIDRIPIHRVAAVIKEESQTNDK